MPATEVKRSRRAFLRAGRPAPRPWLPWSTPDAIVEHCLRCGACTEQCPEQVIIRGDGGFPSVDATHGECSFCGTCVTVCPAPVFERDREPPWPLMARVADTCLEQAGIACRACEDACPHAALRFRPRLGGGAEVQVDDSRCTGCGACVAPCPAGAVSLAVSDGQASANA